MKYIINDKYMKKYEADTTYEAGYQMGYQVGYEDARKLKYEADTTYEAGYQMGYQVGYEDAQKKFDPLYFEPGDVVENEDGIKYAFINNDSDCGDSNAEYYHFVRMSYPVNNLINRRLLGKKATFSRSYLIDHKFIKTGEKVALVYIDNA